MIYRTVKNINFVVLDKGFLSDERLGFAEKGMLTFLLSKPDKWKPKSEHLKTVGTDGRDACLTILKNLEKNHYLWRGQVQDEKTGKVEWITVAFESNELYYEYCRENGNPVMLIRNRKKKMIYEGNSEGQFEAEKTNNGKAVNGSESEKTISGLSNIGKADIIENNDEVNNEDKGNDKNSGKGAKKSKTSRKALTDREEIIDFYTKEFNFDRAMVATEYKKLEVWCSPRGFTATAKRFSNWIVNSDLMSQSSPTPASTPKTGGNGRQTPKTGKKAAGAEEQFKHTPKPEAMPDEKLQNFVRVIAPLIARKQSVAVLVKNKFVELVQPAADFNINSFYELLTAAIGSELNVDPYLLERELNNLVYEACELAEQKIENL